MTDTRLPLRAETPWRNIDGNVLVVKPTEGILYPLNSVGSRIWCLADGRRTVEEIAEVLADEFDAPADAIRKDTRLFLEQLQAASLMTIRKKES